MTLTAEFELALACCRWVASRGDAGEIASLARSVDWPRFLRVVRRHRVQGLVARALAAASVEPTEAVAAAIAQDAAGVAEQNLRAARESAALAGAFADAGIPFLFVKGLTLSALAYGDAFVKMAVDIDLLVGGGDSLEEAAATLSRCGFEPVLPANGAAPGALSDWHRRHKESVWRNSGGVSLDLHTRLSDNPALIPSIGASSPRQQVAIAPGVTLPTLTNDDLFAYLCVHGASSAWFRLKWIADLAALVHRMDEADAERLYRHAQACGAGRSAAQALLLADTLSLLDLPDPLRRELDASAANRLVARAALSQLLHEREPTKRLLGTASIHWTQLLLLDGWRFRLGEAKRQVRGLVDRPA